MHHEAFTFTKRFASDDKLSVIEIGSRNINGTARILFPNSDWLGLDLYEGQCVDVVCDAATYTPVIRVSMVVCMEVLEHAADWRRIIQQAAKWLKPCGRLIITCAGPGRLPHSHHDGGELRSNEYYLNLSESDIRQEIEIAGLREIEVLKNGVDTYATAIR